MAKLSASTIFGKLKVAGEAIVNKALTVKDTIYAKNGVEVEGGNIDQYATVRAGANAENGHLMLEANGGNVYTARDGGTTKLNSPQLRGNLDASSNGINNLNDIRFKNVEHTNLGNLGVGWDNSEGGGGMDGGLIVKDVSGNNGWVVHSSQGAYDIQKNGTDGTGIINFKT